MILYLLKMTLCASLLLLAYHFLLEKEKMHRFKRAYLLAALILSITVPFIETGVDVDIPVITESMISFENYNNQTHNIIPDGDTVMTQDEIAVIPLSPEKSQKEFPIEGIIIISYVLICMLLFIRFCVNIFRLMVSIKRNEVLDYYGAKIILTGKESVPYSFFNYIFVYRNDFENKEIKQEIFLHELTHVRQKHSLDIVFMELLSVLLWFNPVIYFYKSKIKLNHEFLADENVIGNCEDISHYQMILINNISKGNKLSLASNFNYLITKKRLIMMTKISSRKIMALKTVGLVPLLVATILLFSSGTGAINNNSQEGFNNDLEFVHDTISPQGASKKMLDEYETIREKYKTPDGRIGKMSEADGNRILVIAKQMNEEQRKKYEVRILYVGNEGGKEISQSLAKEYENILKKYSGSDGKPDLSKISAEDKERIMDITDQMSDEQFLRIYGTILKINNSKIYIIAPGKGNEKVASQEMVDEFKTLIDKYRMAGGNGKIPEITQKDKERLLFLGENMTEIQRMNILSPHTTIQLVSSEDKK